VRRCILIPPRTFGLCLCFSDGWRCAFGFFSFVSFVALGIANNTSFQYTLGFFPWLARGVVKCCNVVRCGGSVEVL